MLWLHGLTSNGQHMWGFLLHNALLFFYQKRKRKDYLFVRSEVIHFKTFSTTWEFLGKHL